MRRLDTGSAIAICPASKVTGGIPAFIVVSSRAAKPAEAATTLVLAQHVVNRNVRCVGKCHTGFRVHGRSTPVNSTRTSRQEDSGTRWVGRRKGSIVLHLQFVPLRLALCRRLR